RLLRATALIIPHPILLPVSGLELGNGRAGLLGGRLGANFGQLPVNMTPFVLQESAPMTRMIRLVIIATALVAVAPRLRAQGRGQANPQLIQERWSKEKELESLAVIDRKVM